MLTGSTVHLVLPTKDDWENVKSIWEDEETMAGSGGAIAVSKEKYLEWWQEMYDKNEVNNCYFMIMDDENRRCFGEVSFFRSDYHARKARFDVRIRKPYRNRHYAKEASALLLEYFFIIWRGEALESSVERDNTEGAEFLKRLGFSRSRSEDGSISMTLDRATWIRGERT
jgi:RimJ/RimL family protein N-acetyltransferase